MPDDKLPIPEFAAKIKAKYPAYKDMNDTLLTQKIIEKYPQYKDQVDVSGLEVNVGGGLGESGKTAPPTKPTAKKDFTLRTFPSNFRRFDPSLPADVQQANKKVAAENYQNKSLTENDVDWLAATPSGDAVNPFVGISKNADAKSFFVNVHNGLHTKDILGEFDNYFDTFNPKSDTTNEAGIAANKERDKLKLDILNGDLSKLTDLKDKVISGLNKQKESLVSTDVTPTDPVLGGMSGGSVVVDKAKATAIDEQIKKANADFGTFARIAAANKYVPKPEDRIKRGTEVAGLIGKELEEHGYGDYNRPSELKKRNEVLMFEKTSQKRIDDLQRSLATATPHEKVLIQTRIDNLKKYAADFPVAAENINYQREYLGNEAIALASFTDANELYTNGLLSGNQMTLHAANNNMSAFHNRKDANDNLIYKYPDVGIQQNARLIADKLDELGMGGFRNDNTLHVAAMAIDKDSPGYYEANKPFIDALHTSMLPSSTLGQHFARGVEEDFGRKIFGTGSPAEKLLSEEFLSRYKTTSRAGGEPEKIVWSPDDKAFELRSNESYHDFDFNNIGRVIGKQSPALMKWIIEAEATGAIGEGVGLFGTAGEAATATRRAIQLTKNLKETTKLLVPMYIESYNSNRELADDLIKGTSGQDEFKKDLLANGMTVLSAAVFRAFDFAPNKAIQRMWTKTVMPDAVKAFEKDGWKALTNPEFYEQVVVPKTQRLLTSLGKRVKEVAKGGAAITADANTKALLASIVNPDMAHVPTAKEDVQTFSEQALLLGIAGLPGALMDGSFTKSKLNKDLMYESGLLAPKYIQSIDAAMKKGDIAPEQGNKAISFLKTLQQESYKAITQTTDDGLPLTSKQKRDIAMNNVRRRAALQAKEDGTLTETQANMVVAESDKAVKEIKKDVRLNPMKTEVKEDGTVEMKEEKPTVQSAVIEINGKTYEGKNHAEAILKAQEAGEDISQVNRQQDGKFKLSNGEIIDRAEAKTRFGQDRSELLIEQDDAAKQANEKLAAQQTQWQVGDVIPADYPRPEKKIKSIGNNIGETMVKVEFEDGSKGAIPKDKAGYLKQISTTTEEEKITEVEKPTNLKELIDKYDEGDIGTFGDLVNEIESHGKETGNSEILAAVDAYKRELEYDRSISGRHDYDMIEKDFLDKINSIKEEPPTVSNEVKNKGVLYQGTSLGNAEKIMNQGYKKGEQYDEVRFGTKGKEPLDAVWLSRDKTLASNYADENVNQTPSRLIHFDESNLKIADNKIYKEYVDKFGDNAEKQLKKDGYDGADINADEASETKVWNYEKLKPSKVENVKRTGFDKEAQQPTYEYKAKQEETINTLQGSYDRLLAAGTDMNEPEMVSLKKKIDSLKAELPKEKKAEQPKFKKETPQSAAKKVYADIGEIGEPSDARGLALEYFAGGGKVSEESVNEISGTVKKAELNTGRKTKKSSEVKARDYAAKDAPTTDQIAHSIWDNLDESLRDKITTQDIKNELENVINSHNTRLSAATEFRDRYIVDSAKGQLTEDEAKYNSEKDAAEFNRLFGDLPEDQQQDIVNVLGKYKDQQGNIDWAAAEKDSNGFDPEMLSLPEETQKSLYDLIEKNLKSGQGERSGVTDEDTGEKKSQEAAPEEVGSGIPPPPDEKIPPTEQTPDERWTGIRQEKLAEIDGAKDILNKSGRVTWNETNKNALENLQARFPDKPLYDAARERVQELATLANNKVPYSATSEDVAVMQYFNLETQRKISEIQGWDSPDEVQRLLAIEQWKNLNNDLLMLPTASKGAISEAARALYKVQEERRLDPEYGLQIRRMELLNAKGGDKLNDEELKWTADQWEKEKELLIQEHEAREKGMQDAFDQKIASLTKEYEDKLAEASKKTKQPRTIAEKRESKLKESGKKAADWLRSGKLKGGTYSTIPGFPQAVNLVIEAIAQIVEKGATIADAIQQYIEKHKIQDTEKFKNNLFDAIEAKQKGNDALDEIRKVAEADKVTGITNDMVGKNHIRDFVQSYVGDIEPNKILDAAHEDLKKVLPDVTKQQLREAFLKEGSYRQPTEEKIKSDIKKDAARLTRIEKIEKDLSDLQDQKKIVSRSKNKGRERKIDADIEKAENKLKAEMVEQGVKFSHADKFQKASYDSRAAAHNERVDAMSNNIKELLNDDIPIAQRNRLEKLKSQLDAAKILLDPESRLDQSPLFDKALNLVKAAKSEFERGMDIADRRNLKEVNNGLQGVIDKFSTDKAESEQHIKLQRQKNSIRTQNSERERKLNAGEYVEQEPVPLKKTDAELVKIKIARDKLESERRKREKQEMDKNKGIARRSFEAVRGLYVAALIMRFGTALKVTGTTLWRPTQEAISKSLFGQAFRKFFPTIYERAKAGGESSSWRSIARSYQALFRQVGAKKLEEVQQKSNDRYEQSAKEYYDYKNSDNPDAKKLESLKNKMNNDMLTSMGNLLYQYIGGSSIQDALQALLYRSNIIERQFGNLEKETIKDGGTPEKLNYIFGFIGRSHSALKTFSARANFAAGFVARLEAAMHDDPTAINPDKILEIANDSYLDWERGKYIQSNFVSDAWNKITQHLENDYKGTEWDKYSKATSELLKFDVAITRVPVNILHEAVAEYGAGAFRSMWMAAQEYRKAKKQVQMNEALMPTDKEMKDAIKEQLASMDKDKAALIARCFRKGGFGLGVFALTMLSGLVHFGGFHHKGEKKKKESELADDELNPGEVMFGKNKVGEKAGNVIEHLTGLYPAFFGLNAAKLYNEKINKGETTLDGAIAMAMGSLEAIQDAIPQTQIVNPIGISKQVIKGGLHQIEKQWEANDVDANGDLIKRHAMDFKDEINLLRGNRKEVLTEENYKKAISIQNNYARAIEAAKKEGLSDKEIEDMKKERDEAIKQLYQFNKEPQ